ncbi:STAS domain-containing protein [Streptomyces sp. NPDC050147]|uniref:STAS domain-containing protein n=1 Tax=Streptomyces sp. NPDC050147 TaxID=3155513 RepID=UPI003442A6E2
MKGANEHRKSAGARLTILQSTAVDARSLTLTLTGELDSGTVAELCEITAQALARGQHHLVLDLSQITWCDNASLHTILGIRHAVHHAGGSLTLANPATPVLHALDGSALRHVLPLTETEGQLPVAQRVPEEPGPTDDHRHT